MARRKIGQTFNEQMRLKVGESCEGFYVGNHQATIDGDDLTFHTFKRRESEGGGKFDILETSVLANKLKEVKPNEYVIITYVGDKKSTKRKGKEFKDFSVEVDDEITE